MAITTKFRKTERIVDLDGTYDVVLEETERKRVFPEDEVREIIAQAIHRGKMEMDKYPEKYLKLFDAYGEIARIALDDINKRFKLTIETKEM